MQTVTTIGLDIAKSVFQVHGVDAARQVLIRRQLKRATSWLSFRSCPPCLVGIEACAVERRNNNHLQLKRPGSRSRRSKIRQRNAFLP